MSTKQSTARRRGLTPQGVAAPRIRVTSKMGHDGQRVIMEWDQQIRNFQLTPEECKAHILALQNTLKSLEDHIASHLNG